MEKVRLMNTNADYEKIGVKRNQIEMWEDGKRDESRSGAYEWWYFDMILDDGSKAVIHFNTKATHNIHHDGCLPSVVVKLTTPDGETYMDSLEYDVSQATFSTEKCDVKIGEHFVSGDLKEYKIHVEPLNGMGVDLTLTSMSKPWRPEAGYYVFGDDENGYFTWLCVIPKGKVTGTMTVNGITKEVTGFGYHDHQWGNVDHMFTWNHWLWSRQNFDDYTILVFDLVTNKEYGYQRFPMVFVEDKDGNIIFETCDKTKVHYEVIEEFCQENTGKYYPKKSKYTFEDCGKKIEYTLDVQQELQARNYYGDVPEEARKVFDLKNVQPTYSRVYATGDLKITEKNTVIERKGDLIYEFVYVGKTYKEFM